MSWSFEKYMERVDSTLSAKKLNSLKTGHYTRQDSTGGIWTEG